MLVPLRNVRLPMIRKGRTTAHIHIAEARVHTKTQISRDPKERITEVNNIQEQRQTGKGGIRRKGANVLATDARRILR